MNTGNIPSVSGQKCYIFMPVRPVPRCLRHIQFAVYIPAVKPSRDRLHHLALVSFLVMRVDTIKQYRHV